MKLDQSKISKISIWTTSLVAIAFLWHTYKRKYSRHFRRYVIRLLFASLEDTENGDSDTSSSTSLTEDDNEEEISSINIEGERQSDEIMKDKILNITGNSVGTNPNSTDTTETTNPNSVGYDEIIDSGGNVDAESSFSSSSESTGLATPEITSSVSSTQNARVQTVTDSILKVDIDEIQSSLNAQISSPVVQTLRSNEEFEQNTEKRTSTDEFPFLMGGSTVCEYIGGGYEEVVAKNSPNTAVLRVHVNDSFDDVNSTHK